MDSLDPDALSEVLAFLGALDVSSLAACSWSWRRRVQDMAALADADRFQKVVSFRDPTYDDHFLFHPIRGTSAVTFRFPIPDVYEDPLVRKLLLQLLNLNGERDAVRWLACRMDLRAPPKPSAEAIFLFRHMSWDVTLYSIACRALLMSSDRRRPRPMHLHVLSVPAIHDGQRQLGSSAQPFLCNLLRHTRGRPLHLHVEGESTDLPHVPLTPDDLEVELRRVDAVLERPNWALHVDVSGVTDFRSSTVAVGTALEMADPDVRTLALKHYAFDELHQSMDAQKLVAWLETGGHSLTRVHLHGISFSTGLDFCLVLRALCKVPSLQALHLNQVEHLTEAVADPLTILFEEGRHIKDLRLGGVMRTQVDFPFAAIHPPGPRCLGLTRMFLDTEKVQPLVHMLPRLTQLASLDLSYNGLDCDALRLFAVALRSKTCTLQRLKLASNIISHAKVFLFCEALAVNRTLQHLDLSENFLGSRACRTLIQTMLVDNATLKYVNLDNNQVNLKMSDLYRIVLSMGEAQPLRQISLRNNPIFFEKRHDEEMYVHFFSTEYNVSFKF
jgi:hypothetical protein